MVELPKPTTHRVRVNGAILSQFHDKPVCLLGTVIKADGGGTAFQVKASDGPQVTVRLKKPISEPLTGLVEVYGIGQGKGLIVSATYTSFPDSMTSSYDLNIYNEAVKIMHSIEGNPWLPASD